MPAGIEPIASTSPAWELVNVTVTLASVGVSSARDIVGAVISTATPFSTNVAVCPVPATGPYRSMTGASSTVEILTVVVTGEMEEVQSLTTTLITRVMVFGKSLMIKKVHAQNH